MPGEPGRPVARCSPQTSAATSGVPAATLTSKATEVAHGTVAGHAWSLWSRHGQSGATGLEDGGLLVDGRAYGLCPGFPNPAELELADIRTDIRTGTGAGIVYGVIGYPGRRILCRVVIRLPSADLLVRLHNGLRTNLVAAVVAFPGARFDDNQGCR